MLGKSHDFLSLWNNEHEIAIDFQIPSSISVSLKWNQIGSGITDERGVEAEKQIIETIIASEKQETVSGKRQKLPKTPVYVILTTYNGLLQKFGEKSADY